MRMKPSSTKIMILGASELQLPAILKAREMGLCVGVVDYDPNAVGIPFADEYFDVSTIDEEGVLQAATSFGTDAILTLATDMPIRAVARTCEKLGLVGNSYETAIKATDKAEMMRAFALNKLEHPWFLTLDSADDIDTVRNSITYPCVCKPTDSSGSRGVSLVPDDSELDNAIDYSVAHGISGEIIIEEYLEGVEVSVEIIVYEGEILVTMVTDKYTAGAPNFVEIGHSQPSQLAEEKIVAISHLAQKAVRSLGINYGAAHVEIMYTKEGPKLIELGARLGGDFIASNLVPLSTGIDLVKAVIDIACGKQPEVSRKHSRGSAIKYFDCPSGIIAGISGLDRAANIPGVVNVKIHKRIGDEIGTVKNSAERLGFVIAQGDTASAALKACESAIQAIVVDFSE